MRLGKFHVVLFALVCLLLTVPAQAQFGKLKSMVKDKMGANTSPTQQVAKAQRGSAGEAKATFAPGVQKSVNVKRQGSGTPEASVVTVAVGRPQTVTIKVSGLDARQFDTVSAYSPCNKVSNFVILSATQVKLTIDLTGAKGNGCQITFLKGGEALLSTTVGLR